MWIQEMRCSGDGELRKWGFTQNMGSSGVGEFNRWKVEKLGSRGDVEFS